MSSNPTSTCRDLAGQMQQWVVDRTDAAIRRYLPNLRVPGFFAGYRINGDYSIDLGYVLKYLHLAGAKRVGGWDVLDAMRRILRQIDGDKTETFYSYRTAEMLLAFGPFVGNPLLDGFTDAEKANVADAVDSTFIYDQWGKPLGGRPNNYWGVLARCEDARQRLGLPINRSILDEAVGHCRRMLFDNPLGFFDDSAERSGRFDIYSPDVHLFLEPLWERFDAARLRQNLATHTRLLESLALENGATIAWGRSIGALSVCLTMELGAVALRDGLCTDSARVLALVQHAFEQFKTWFADDLIAAHRGRMTMGYRGPHRLLQMTFDCLGKVCYAARALANGADATNEVASGAALRSAPAWVFPPADEWVALDDRGAGVWMFRNPVLAFQLAAVSGNGSDYVAAPRGPGLFENPVDSPMLCWTPRAAAGSCEYAATGVPALVEKSPNGLRLTYAGWTRVQGKEGPDRLGGSRVVSYRVDGDTIGVTERWTFDTPVDAVSLMVPETPDRPLQVRFQSADEHSASVVNVRGMQLWRSFWGELARVHQIDFAPQSAIELAYTVTPTVKVAHGPADHDYNRGIYDAMPPDAVREIGFNNGVSAHLFMDVQRLCRDAEVVHIGWPEHLFSPHGLSEQEMDQRTTQFVEQLGRSGKKIVWTMHNRRPHSWQRERGIALYRQWAPVVDACLHHSRWGMDLMRAEYPFRDDCLHALIPHGHFGQAMQVRESREELERQFNLPACTVRIGVLGRYQKEKQIELLLQAYLAAGRRDVQLVTTSYTPEVPLPDGPGIYKLPRNKWMRRPEIAQHTAVCDVLLAAHTGDTYLTSGLVGDAVAAGVAMLVPDWAFFREIMGDAAIYHDNTEAGIARAIAGLSPKAVEQAKAKTRALYDAYDWRVLAPKIMDIFRGLRMRGDGLSG